MPDFQNAFRPAGAEIELLATIERLGIKAVGIRGLVGQG